MRFSYCLNYIPQLTWLKTRHHLDIHLSGHIQDLSALIRDRALVLYFQPFQSIRLGRMGEAFGMTIEEIEKHIIRLIQSGDIKARVDSQNKVDQLSTVLCYLE